MVIIFKPLAIRGINWFGILFICLKVMNRFILVLFLLNVSITVLSQKIKEGYWGAKLLIQEGKEIPIKMQVLKQRLFILNDTEKIELEAGLKRNDSIIFQFHTFNTCLSVKINQKNMSGYFVNNDRKSNKQIPFLANYCNQKNIMSPTQTDYFVGGKWKVIFSPDQDGQYPAIGQFEQNNLGQLSGTFRTETGDYRFLSGNIIDDKMTLYCFDGSHTFLFEANLKDEKLNGIFYSGLHWRTNWIGERDEEFELSDPNEITFLSDSAEAFSFSKPQLNGERYYFPNETTKDKVVIIQIIGTWCPNCLDETLFFNELYNEFHEDGLEIIGIAYEVPADFVDQVSRIKNFKDKRNVKYPILVGGKASKSVASEDFPMLNKISSFPTSIILNKTGEIEQIHTGFNGPGTGKVYDEYVIKMRELIKQLIEE